MWKAAEEIVDILNKEKFTLPQDYFIWHYVNFLKGVDNLSELAMFEFMRFRLFVSRAVDMNKPNGKDKK